MAQRKTEKQLAKERARGLRKENYQPELRAIREKISANIAKKFPFAKKGLQRIPKDPLELHKLAQEFIAWASKSDSLIPDDFALSKGMNPYSLRHTLLANEELKETIMIVYSFISKRLQEGALYKDSKVESHSALSLLPKYDADYREWLIQKVSKNIEANKQTIIKVIDYVHE